MASTAVEDHGYIIEDLNVCLITFSTIFILLRCYVRRFMLNSMGWDDAFAVIAWAALIVQSALEIIEANNGPGRHIQDAPSNELAQFFSILPTMELLYFVATCFVRHSVVAVLLRISKEKMVTRTVSALGCIIVAMSLICFFVLLFSCKHVPDLRNEQNTTAQCATPLQQSYLFWSHIALGICVDVVLLVFPIWLTYSRMMHSMASIKVILVFGVGFFVLITGIVRLVIIISVNYAVDTTLLFLSLPNADLKGHIDPWLACFPSLQSLIRLAAKKIRLGSKALSNNGPAVNSNNWGNKSRGYVKSGPEVHVGGDRSSVFDDDSSTKKIIMVDEREVGMEMGRVQSAMARGQSTMGR